MQVSGWPRGGGQRGSTLCRADTPQLVGPCHRTVQAPGDKGAVACLSPQILPSGAPDLPCPLFPVPSSSPGRTQGQRGDGGETEAEVDRVVTQLAPSRPHSPPLTVAAASAGPMSSDGLMVDGFLAAALLTLLVLLCLHWLHGELGMAGGACHGEGSARWGSPGPASTGGAEWAEGRDTSWEDEGPSGMDEGAGGAPDSPHPGGT